MATKTVKVSDLTGAEICDENRLARLVVEDHPDIPESVTLEVLPEEIEDQLPEVQNYVSVTYFPPTDSDRGPQTFVMSTEEFNNLSTDWDMGTVLQSAHQVQLEEDGRRRGRRGRRRTGDRRPRVDYSSPEHAGEPHRGRITDAEKEYVQENLTEVNVRLERDGLRTIDPNDRDMAERYGLTGEN